MPEDLSLVDRSLDPANRRAFERRVQEQAEGVRDAIRRGDLDNPSYAIGLELEAYAVDDDGRLARIPEAAFESSPLAKELGLHNAELNTAATAFTDAGLRAQIEELRRDLDAARDVLDTHGLTLVLDGMWTIPPPEGSREYLSAVTETDGFTLATNMRPDPRYRALDNDIVRHRGGHVTIDVPGATFDAPTILLESLTTSIQPHLQIPAADAFPAHYNAAIRTLGPVLALATNSPLLPADCYDDVDPDWLLDATPHELRVPVFERSINADTPGKVRFPGDIETATDVVDRYVADALRAPVLREWVEADDPDGFGDTYWELDFKRGTYWRWLRCVVGGQAIDADNDERSLRIEYRPLPTQPSLADVVGLQALVSGLVRGLVEEAHPLVTLDWETARDAFYAAVADGPDADLAWVTADGDETRDHDAIYDEVFAYADRGLRAAGVDASRADELLRPIRARRDRGTVPSRWKLDRVRDALDDGYALPAAIERMQRAYIRNAGTDTPFVDWAG